MTWPRQEGRLVLVSCPMGFYVLGALSGGFTRGVLYAAAMFPVLLVLWAFHRVLKAWAEWPARRRWVRGIKAAVRYLLTDP